MHWVGSVSFLELADVLLSSDDFPYTAASNVEVAFGYLYAPKCGRAKFGLRRNAFPFAL